MTETTISTIERPPAALTLHQLAAVLGKTYVSTWELVQRGGLPFEVIRLGNRYAVPREPVERVFGREAVRRALGEPEAAS